MKITWAMGLFRTFILALLLAQFSGYAVAQDAAPEADLLEIQPEEPEEPEVPSPPSADDIPGIETEKPEEAAGEPKEIEVAEVKSEPSALAKFNGFAFSILFYDLSGGAITMPKVDHAGEPVLDKDGQPEVMTVTIPLLIVVLLAGAIFFTFYYRFINFRGFKHAIQVVAGKFDKDTDEGEISHFRALTSALSATVGLGNIAGVAVAIMAGGPGAVFWMILVAFFGMSAKFSSCTLAQLYRKVNKDGSISGGPMYYLDIGLKNMGLATLGKILAVMYAVMVMGGALGGGNMFQANQTAEAIVSTFGVEGDAAQANAKLGIGITMAVFVGLVIIGGIRRIGLATSRVVPTMCGLYVVASIYIILSNIGAVPAALGLIFQQAFTENAVFGGMLGVLVQGVKRAAFSNEAGLGSAAIAHAAAKTDEPVREGIVAMIGPFIDTVIICLMTSLVVIVTGVYAEPEFLAQGTGFKVGVTMTTTAFGSSVGWFEHVLTACIALFAYSTMIAWCYYGERGWIYLMDHFGNLGHKTVIVFRLIFVAAVVYGAIKPLADVLDFSDVMILSMAFPNIIGSMILAPKVMPHVKSYCNRFLGGKGDSGGPEAMS